MEIHLDVYKIWTEKKLNGIMWYHTDDEKLGLLGHIKVPTIQGQMPMVNQNKITAITTIKIKGNPQKGNRGIIQLSETVNIQKTTRVFIMYLIRKEEWSRILLYSPDIVVTSLIDQEKLGGNIKWKKNSPKYGGDSKCSSFSTKDHPET